MRDYGKAVATSVMASSEAFEVVLAGGGPWGFRLQGGKEFRAPLKIAKVCAYAACLAENCHGRDFHKFLPSCLGVTIFGRRHAVGGLFTKLCR